MDAVRFAPNRFPAAVVRSRTVGELAMTETRYAGDAALQPHSHEYACLVVVLRGTFRERFGAKQRDGAPGMIIMRPEGELHSNRFSAGGGRCLNIELPPRWIARVRNYAKAFDTSAAFTGDAFALVGRRLHEELANGDDLSPLAVESIVLSMFVDATRELKRAPGTPPRWLLATKDRIDADVAVRLSLDDLAASAGVHPVHLAAAFRRYFGKSVAAYIRQQRIEYACRALADTDTPLAEIALAAGFADQSHFGRTFKQLMRMTPAAYRGHR
jgi:AraC family transcriptional regulator